MRKSLISGTFILLTLFFGQSSIFAWHDEGHKLTTYIAWQRMTPQAREAAVRLLRATPEDSMIGAYYMFYGIQPEEMRKMLFFVQMGTYADMARDRAFPNRMQKYHHSNWHYYDTFWKQIDGKIVPVPVEEEGGQALNKLIEFEKLLRDAATKESEKGIGLVWILHLMGDLHQPLHNSARVTDTEPKGDQGGNLFLLTPQGTQRDKQYALHTYWDGITNRSVPIREGQAIDAYISELAQKIVHKYPYDKLSSALKPGQFKAWHEEGLDLANTVVFSPDLKRFEMPSEKYQKKAFETAERQIALAGYRMADLLNAALAAPAAPATAPN